MFTCKKSKLSWVSVPDFGWVDWGGSIFRGLVLHENIIRDIHTHISCIFPLTQIYSLFSLLYPLSFALISFVELLY